ncbi:MAG: hypothetical protein HC888_04255 [Candidatus Competibacteraceae bacterium]|nr:hypothetical protein [Candidatus Competibacteraceae bacterium]
MSDLYRTHGDELFSANVRDFLGVTRRKGNINGEIKQTASSEPENFWVFNNGITALTNRITKGKNDITLDGISIINGAQTTGALGSSEQSDIRGVEVLCRVVECTSEQLVNKIVRFNNTQNVIRPSDLQASHPVQKRLVQEFSKYGIAYVVRRTSTRAVKNSISAEGVAPSLCAFHGDPQTATRSRRDIFESDKTFATVFPGDVSAGHIFLVHSIAMAFDSAKIQLKKKVNSEDATQQEKSQYEVLRYAASRAFIIFLFGRLAEEILNRKVASIIKWRLKEEQIMAGNEKPIIAFKKVLSTLLPHIALIVGKIGQSYDVTRSKTDSASVADSLKAVVASLESYNSKQFKEVRRITEV